MEEREEEPIPVSIDADELINEVRELPEMDEVAIQIPASVELSPILGDIIEHNLYAPYVHAGNSEYQELEAFVDTLRNPTISSQRTVDGYQDMHTGMITRTTPRAVVEAALAIADSELAETGNAPTIATSNATLEQAIRNTAVTSVQEFWDTQGTTINEGDDREYLEEDEDGDEASGDISENSTWGEDPFVVPPVPTTFVDAIVPEIIVPVNSETINTSDVTSRFSGAIWAEKMQTKQVILAGLGGIGSYEVCLYEHIVASA